MQLLNTIAKPNSLVAHALDFVAIYNEPTVSLYKKLPDANELSLVTEYTLAGVKRLALSDNGQVLSAQTATQTHRLSVVGASPYDVVGQLAVADRNYTVVLTPTAVQVIRETVVNMNTTLSTADRVVCGVKTFVVYNSSRYILGSYDAGLQAPVSPGRTIGYVAHVGEDKFAYFYLDGTVGLGATVRALPALGGHRDSGRHVVANDGAFEYAFMRQRPLTIPVKIRPYTPPPIVGFFVLDTNGAPAVGFTIQKTVGVTQEDPASIGDTTYILPNGTTDGIDIIFDTPINLAATDWTLEWTSQNLGTGGTGYFAEIALLAAPDTQGVEARYGDNGFGHRLQFGGLVNGTSNVWSVSSNKTTLNGVLKKYAMVKQGSNIAVYIDGIRQNLAVGTGADYSIPSFPIDTNISAIKYVRVGSTAYGGAALAAKRANVRLSLYARYTGNYTPA